MSWKSMLCEHSSCATPGKDDNLIFLFPYVISTHYLLFYFLNFQGFFVNNCFVIFPCTWFFSSSITIFLDILGFLIFFLLNRFFFFLSFPHHVFFSPRFLQLLQLHYPLPAFPGGGWSIHPTCFPNVDKSVLEDEWLTDKHQPQILWILCY